MVLHIKIKKNPLIEAPNINQIKGSFKILEKSVPKTFLNKNFDLDSIFDEIKQIIYVSLPPWCVEQDCRRKFLQNPLLDRDSEGFLQEHPLEPYFSPPTLPKHENMLLSLSPLTQIRI